MQIFRIHHISLAYQHANICYLEEKIQIKGFNQMIAQKEK